MELHQISIAHHESFSTSTWPRAPNGLSNEHLVFGPYYLGSLLFAGHRGGGASPLVVAECQTWALACKSLSCRPFLFSFAYVCVCIWEST